MINHDISRASTTEGLPVAPSLGPTLAEVRAPRRSAAVDRRVVYLSALSLGLACAAALVAQALQRLISLITNIAFYGTVSFSAVSPAENQLGPWVIVVPVFGALIVGAMARYGSKAIRGHGIPEAMEQVLLNKSRIPKRITLLKPLSAAVAIGTGGPFGAEGPIIATGGALGSLIGQVLSVTPQERKTLLAAGAAAGMSATFGSPVSAVLLAIELLLFEYRARSVVPVALASAAAAGIRMSFVGWGPMFRIPDLAPPEGGALAVYIVVGGIVGFGSILVTRLVYAIEDGFEKLPIHWMWWPALGGIAVGVVGYFAPRTLGVGYDNIEHLVGGDILGTGVLFLAGMKLISWSISLGSGTSGGTLAPLFTIGAGMGSLLGAGAALLLPAAGVDVRIAALVGMASLFAGASRALLASIVFAFETTLQPMGLLPLLGGCTAAYLISSLGMRHTIMTEKIARRGVRVPAEYGADFFDQVLVRDAATKDVVTLAASDTIEKVRSWLHEHAEESSHQGYPVVDANGDLIGVVTRRELLNGAAASDTLAKLIHRPPAVVFDDSSLRDAIDHLVREGIGRLPVVARTSPRKVIGILTRSDILSANALSLSHGEKEKGLRRMASRARRAAQAPEP
jgi:H+/Cl- antiporter ClcA/CBS domain-containing protein